MSSRIAFTADQKLKSRLEEVSDQTGLSQSEIARRAVLNELQKLEV